MDHTPGQCQFTNLSKYTNFTCEKSGAGWTAFKQCLTPVTVNPAADVGLLGGGF
jgi:alpha-D-ribose 1-methylphosphonate 5-triphosphate diphosphatase PhnM